VRGGAALALRNAPSIQRFLAWPSALPSEAEQILLTAAKAGGMILHVRSSSGEAIQAGGTNVIPDQISRTIADWVGGLEDLARRRCIKDMGHKREVYEVTREGYRAADELTSSGSVLPPSTASAESTDDE
jgi:hypothetical protein